MFKLFLFLKMCKNRKKIFLKKGHIGKNKNFSEAAVQGCSLEKCSENVQHTYRGTPMLKYDFNKVALQNTFFSEHLWTAASVFFPLKRPFSNKANIFNGTNINIHILSKLIRFGLEELKLLKKSFLKKKSVNLDDLILFLLTLLFKS